MKNTLILFFFISPAILFAQSIDSLKVFTFETVDFIPRFEKTKCKSKWKKDKLKKCVNNEFFKIITNKFDTNIPATLGLESGVYKNVTEFVINTKGNIINLHSNGDVTEIRDEIIRVVKSFPKLKPGVYNKKPVLVSYKLPFTFKVK